MTGVQTCALPISKDMEDMLYSLGDRAVEQVMSKRQQGQPASSSSGPAPSFQQQLAEVRGARHREHSTGSDRARQRGSSTDIRSASPMTRAGSQVRTLADQPSSSSQPVGSSRRGRTLERQPEEKGIETYKPGGEKDRDGNPHTTREAKLKYWYNKMKSNPQVEHNLHAAKITGWDPSWTREKKIEYWFDHHGKSTHTENVEHHVVSTGKVPKR